MIIAKILYVKVGYVINGNKMFASSKHNNLKHTFALSNKI